MTRRDAALRRGMVRRLLRAWDQATAEDLAAGLSWFARSADLAESLSAGTNLTPAQCSGIIAALSPRCGWSANVRGAVAMVAAATSGASEPVVAGTRANRRKGWAIATGADPSAVLSGPKVSAFWANLCGDLDAVTVDVWAARAAEGPRFKDRAPDGSRYARIADAYRAAAAVVGIAPRDLQAAVWTSYRRRFAASLFDLPEED